MLPAPKTLHRMVFDRNVDQVTKKGLLCDLSPSWILHVLLFDFVLFFPD
jgi:hypothetical protein